MKNIKDYLHLYLGCECTVEWKPFMNRNDSRHLIDGWVLQMSHNATESIKPILRPLSDMTEEEAIDIAIIMYGQPDSVKWRMEDKGNYFNVYRKHYAESFTIDKASGDIDRYSKGDGGMDLDVTLQHHFITAYMLSKGFDLFGLIEAGLAIDKTKLSNQ